GLPSVVVLHPNLLTCQTKGTAMVFPVTRGALRPSTARTADPCYGGSHVERSRILALYVGSGWSPRRERTRPLDGRPDPRGPEAVPTRSPPSPTRQHHARPA